MNEIEGVAIFIRVVRTSEGEDQVAVERFYEGALQEFGKIVEDVQSQEPVIEALQGHTVVLTEAATSHSRRSRDAVLTADEWAKQLKRAFEVHRDTTLENDLLLEECRTAKRELDEARREFCTMVLKQAQEAGKS